LFWNQGFGLRLLLLMMMMMKGVCGWWESQEELDEMVALEQWDGLALSQQLSEVCLYTPLHSPDLKEIVVVETSVAEQLLQPLEEVEEVNLADQEEGNDRDDPNDHICSQDVFWYPPTYFLNSTIS
jgi:hypothetical protein